MTVIRGDGNRVTVQSVVVEDPVLVDLLSAHPEQRWDELIGRALTVGARGLVTMGLGIDLAELDTRVRRAVEEVTQRAQACALELVDAGRRALEEELDPERRSSLISKALSQFQEARDQLLQGLDPGLTNSQASRMISELETLLGPGGDLERRLAEALDPNADGSGIRRFADSIETRIAELRDVLMQDRGRSLEADRGTAKGIEFEDEVEGRLRRIAERIGGCVVTRVSRQAGNLGPEAFVGDLTMTLPTGHRLVVEAKNVSSIALGGQNGILAELDRALANRNAQIAICVSAQDAFPQEVGPFAVYGDRILAVDDGDGLMLEVAVRWAHAVLSARVTHVPEVNAALLIDRVDRLRSLASRFSATKRSLTDIRGSVDSVREQLEDMRVELLELVDDLVREVQRALAVDEDDDTLHVA